MQTHILLSTVKKKLCVRDGSDIIVVQAEACMSREEPSCTTCLDSLGLLPLFLGSSGKWGCD